MKSTIHIDYDPELKEPVLTVDFVDSDDLKDKMLGIFLSKHIHSDKLLALRFKGEDRVLGVKRKRYQASVFAELSETEIGSISGVGEDIKLSYIPS
jgi:hypothetical protein